MNSKLAYLLIGITAISVTVFNNLQQLVSYILNSEEKMLIITSFMAITFGTIFYVYHNKKVLKKLI